MLICRTQKIPSSRERPSPIFLLVLCTASPAVTAPRFTSAKPYALLGKALANTSEGFPRVQPVFPSQSTLTLMSTVNDARVICVKLQQGIMAGGRSLSFLANDVTKVTTWLMSSKPKRTAPDQVFVFVSEAGGIIL